MGATTIVGQSSFIFNFVSYGLMIKSLRVGYTLEEVAWKTKMSKDECGFSYNQIRMNHLT
jgi:hypothetical protein